MNELYHALSPVAFQLGPVSVRWYGLAYLAGFLCTALVIYATARRWKLRFTLDDLYIVMIASVVGVILGGRLGYVLFYGEVYYASHPLEIFAFSQGGMSFHGGLAGALLAGYGAARYLKMPALTLFDLACIGTPLGLFFGRCANFVNGELWGAPTSLPWGVVFGGSAGMVPRHPSQLYEAALEGLVLFAVLMILARKLPPRPQGSFIGVFLLGYGIIRFCLEFVREPDAQLGYLWGGWLTMGQLLSLPLIIVGVIVIVYAYRVKKPQSGTAINRS